MRIEEAIALVGVPTSTAAEPVDEELVDSAVDHIRTVLTNTIHRGAVEVGTYVLDRFFGGDVLQVASRKPAKGASFRLLAERCGTQELPISKSWLHSAVRITILQRLLPKDSAFGRLPLSHQVILLPLKDPNKVECLAHRAVSERLSASNLRCILRSIRRDSSCRSSSEAQEQAPVVKAIHAIAKFVKSQSTGFSLTCIDKLSDEDAANTLQAAQEALAHLTAIVEKLEVRDARDAFPIAAMAAEPSQPLVSR